MSTLASTRSRASGEADATIIARAGLNRLGIVQWPGVVFRTVPARRDGASGGAGAVAVQCRRAGFPGAMRRCWTCRPAGWWSWSAFQSFAGPAVRSRSRRMRPPMGRCACTTSVSAAGSFPRRQRARGIRAAGAQLAAGLTGVAGMSKAAPVVSGQTSSFE